MSGPVAPAPAAAGESYSNGSLSSPSSGYSTVAVTGSQQKEVLSLAPSGLAAGDYVRLELNRNGTEGSDTLNTHLYVIGWVIEYTASI